jgi:hypothetical protein
MPQVNTESAGAEIDFGQSTDTGTLTEATATQEIATPTTTEQTKRPQTPEEIFAYNPFKKGKPEGTETLGSVKEAPASYESPTNGQPPVATQQPIPTMQPSADIATIQRYLHTQEQPEQQQQQQTQQSQEDPFKVNWDVPDVLIQAIRGDDPVRARQAMSNLVTGVANGVLERVQAQLGEFSRSVPQSIRQGQEIEAANKTFYTTFPHLAKPELGSIVGKVAKAVAQSWKAEGRQVNPTDPAFMDAVENYVVSQGFVLRPQNWAHPRAKPATKAKPAPYHGKQGARPAMNQNAQDIADELGFG